MMRLGRRGQAGVWVGVLVGVMGIAIAPGAGAWVATLEQDSVEAQVADAHLVVRGRVAPLRQSVRDGGIDVEVVEVLKGTATVGGTVRVEMIDASLPAAVASLKWPGEGLFILRRSEAGVVGGVPRFELLRGWPGSFYLFDGGAVSAWMRTGSKSEWAPRRMDGRALTSADEVVAAAREAAAFVSDRTGEFVTLGGREFPPASPVQGLRVGMLRVPVDERVERLVIPWLGEADVRSRARAAGVLAYFPSAENVRRLRRLTWDPGYEVVNARTWESVREWRVMREYPARAAAAKVLRDWGVRQSPVAVVGPHGAYRSVAWWAAVLVTLGVVLVAVAGRRRNGSWRRAVVVCSLLAAAWVGVVGLRSVSTAASVGWAIGGASYEVASSRGGIWLLRVADGAAAAGLGMRSDVVEDAPGYPWFLRPLVAEHEVAWGGFAAARGVVDGGAYRCQVARISHAAVVGLLLVIPAWAAGGWAWRGIRRWRRVRRGLCAVCGYDLRGLGGGRCPECGGLGRWHRVRRGALAAVAALACLLWAGRAEARKVAEWVPSVEAAVDRADRVVRARVRAAPETRGRSIDEAKMFLASGYEAEVLETIKGLAPQGGRLTFFVPYRGLHSAKGDEWLLCLEGNTVAFREDGVAFALDGEERYAFAMDGRPLRVAAEILAVARAEAARGVDLAAVGVCEVQFSALGNLTGAAWHSTLLVPADERLGAMARGWAGDADPDVRARGARALRPFRTAANEARLAAMLGDAWYEVKRRRSSWVVLPEYRELREYPVRAAAAETLRQWGVAVAEAADVGPNVTYRPVPWGRWGLWAGLVVAATCAPWGRRGGVEIRWRVLCASVAFAAAVAVLGWRSHAVCDSVGWADGRWSCEVTSADGWVWFLRVEDGAAARGAGWWAEALEPGEGPWFARIVPVLPGRERSGFYHDGGRIEAAGYTTVAYRTTRVGYGWIVGGLLMPAVVGALARGVTAVRARRWQRAGRCVACGYDLRGSPAGGRCPECGVGRRMRVGRAAAVAAAVLVGVLALPARGEWKPAASVEWAVESAGLVVRGRVVRIGPEDADGVREVTIRVEEVIKGRMPAGGRVTVRLGWRQSVRGVVRAAWEASGPVEVAAVLVATPRGVDAGSAMAWEPLERFQSVYTPGGVMTGMGMTGRRVADYRDLLAEVREAARYAALRGGEVGWASLLYGIPGPEPALPPVPPLPPVDVGRRVKLGSNLPDLRGIGDAVLDYDLSGPVVPVDARLETLAMDWMGRSDPWSRIAGLGAARWLRVPRFTRRAGARAAGDSFASEDVVPWAPDPAVLRRVREMAATVFFQLGREVAAGVVEQAPHPLYAPVQWTAAAWAAGGILVGLGAVAVAARRRWSAGGRVAVILTVLAVLVAWADWRSRRVGESFSYARGDGADWEVTLAEGRILVLRVADGAAGHGWLVRRMGTTSARGQWTRGLRKAADVRGVWPWVTWERGTMAAAQPYSYRAWQTGMAAPPAYAYRAWEVTPQSVAWPLAVWPAVWGAGAVWRVARRRRWRRAGRCGACGYDLRGTEAGRGCPECGTKGATERRGLYVGFPRAINSCKSIGRRIDCCGRSGWAPLWAGESRRISPEVGEGVFAMKRSGLVAAAVIGLAGVVGMSPAAKADVVLDTTYLSHDYTYYNNHAGSENETVRNITSFGTGPDRTISSGDGNSATVGYDISSTGFKVDFSQTRTGTSGSYSYSYGFINFRATDATTQYSLDGAFTFSSPYAELYSILYDRTTGQKVEYSHYTFNDYSSTGGTFTLGGTQGQVNTAVGALSGTLVEGHSYYWQAYSQISASPSADQGADGSGWLSLSFSQASATPIPAAAPAGLALMGAMGLRRRSRRAVVAA